MTKREKDILKFIGGLQGYERKWAYDTLVISENIDKFINETQIGLEQFCSEFKITQKQYIDFVSGNWNYSLSDMSTLEHLWTEYRRGKLKVKLVEIPKSE